MSGLLNTLGSTTFSNASFSAGGRNYDYTTIYGPDKPGYGAEENARVWNVYLDEAENYDADMIQGFRNIIDGLLVFASLFSGVVTTFVAQTSQVLAPDNTQIMVSLLVETNNLLRAAGNLSSINTVPLATLNPNSQTHTSIDVWVNGLFFTSLALSLSTALLTVLAKQWIQAYTVIVPGGAKTRALIRHYRFQGLVKWRLGDVIESLPLILHSSVAVFFIGLALYVSQLSSPLYVIVIIITALTFAFYFGTSILPAFDVACPYRIPFLFSLAKPLAFILRATHYAFLYLWYKITGKREKVMWPKMVKRSLKAEEHRQVFPTSQSPTAAASRACEPLEWVFNHSSNRSVKKVVVEGVCALLDEWNSDETFRQSSYNVVSCSEHRNLFLSAIEYSLSQSLDILPSTTGEDPERTTCGKLIENIIYISRSQSLLSGPITDSRDWRKRIEDALMTAYRGAVSKRYHALSRRLLEWGQPNLLRPGRGNQALLHCVMEGDGEDVRDLLDRGVDIGHRNVNGWTALHAAARFGKLDATMALVERMPGLVHMQAIHPISLQTCTTLDLAVESTDLDVVEYLLDHGASPSVSALHVAVLSPFTHLDSHLAMIKLLLDYGCTFTDDHASRSTSIGLARSLRLGGVVEYLQHYQTVGLRRYRMRARTKVNPTVPVIELSDSDDEQPANGVRGCCKPVLNAVAGPSSRRRPQRLGSSSSVQNIPKKMIPSRAAPLFLPSDEENEPPTAQPPRTLTPAPFPFTPEADPPPTPPAPPQPVPDPDPHSTVTARVLEIVPDVDPDYLLAIVTKHILNHPDQSTDLVIEYILHALFEDTRYPKVDRNKKGKRKQSEQDEPVLSKKSKIDYTDKDRPFKGGEHYTNLALEHLQTAFPLIPKPYLRQILIKHNGLYAPAHLFLVEQEMSHEKRETGESIRLPYVKRATPFLPKGKGIAAQDEELEAERKWLLDQLQRRGDTAVKGQDEEEDDGACEDGIECGCCFSTYRFDKMVQCPETHLFCTTCMRKYASTLLGTHDPNIKCMDQSGCKALIPYSELKRFLPEKLMLLYERVKQRKEVEAAGLDGLEECPFCEWGCVIENPEEKLLRCGNVEACGAPEPGRVGTSDNPNAGKCLLWDSVEQRHADEVKAAAERAQAEYRRDNPDVTDEALKVDLPVAPLPAAKGPGAYREQLLRNAQAALRRAQADLVARQAEEHAHRVAMDKIYAELQYLEELRNVPGMQMEYELQVGSKRADYSRENTMWYRARGLVEHADIMVRDANARVQHAQAAQVYGHGVPYGFGFGMGGLNVNVNVFGGPGMLAAPPPHMRVPPLPAAVGRPRPRAQWRW
ncbi:hypothetical protein C0993_000379 [Termitomyces sp. T159_Od127]|nr:hypothetical protein C0993_000379 [Termitomyces sp. T159_Od127]